MTLRRGVFGLAVALLGCGQAEQGAQSSEEAVVNAKAVELDVTGMVCGGCESAVRDRVSSVSGVVEVKASHKDAKAWVTFDGAKVSEAEIVAVIEKLGYSARLAAAPAPTEAKP
jgi:copper chaperone